MASPKHCSPSHFAQDYAVLTQEESDQDLSLTLIENAFTHYNSQLQQISKGTNGDAEQTSFLHSSQQGTEDEAKACSVFVWACKEETAAPSDNPGQTRLGGTAVQMDFHPFQLYSKKEIGLFTESVTPLHPACLLDTGCFGKPRSKTTPQNQRLQKRSCTTKSLFGKWECLITPCMAKVSLPLLPVLLGA